MILIGAKRQWFQVSRRKSTTTLVRAISRLSYGFKMTFKLFAGMTRIAFSKVRKNLKMSKELSWELIALLSNSISST